MLKLKLCGPNQTLLKIGQASFFFSYETLVGVEDKNGLCYVTEDKYSSTTSRHVKSWLESRKAKTVTQANLEAMLTKQTS